MNYKNNHEIAMKYKLQNSYEMTMIYKLITEVTEPWSFIVLICVQTCASLVYY